MGFSMCKNTVIPEDLLRDIFRLIYYLIDIDIPVEARTLCSSIESGISDLVSRREIRKVFSAYKSAQSGPERETLRLEYVRLAEIHRSFISKHEVPYSSL